MKFRFIFLILFIVFQACKSDTSQVDPPEASLFKEEIPQDFLGFYDRFHSNIDYQMNHIIFPLQEKSDSTLWQKDEWLMHKPFDTQDGEFSRSYTHLNGIVVEVIQDQNGLFKVERRFSKSRDGYDLIYYKITNAFENSDFKEEK
jgi:hypothetical protein